MLTVEDLAPFFDGWWAVPSHERRLGALRGADSCALAFDDGKLVGFATAISDGSLFIFIPLLEVLEPYRRQGIGAELVERVLVPLGKTYGTYLSCDEDVVPFYVRIGFEQQGVAMSRLNGDAV